jgi:hypothetical protein
MACKWIYFSERTIEKRSLERKIAAIPQEDQIVLSCFFRTLVQKFCAGHVLYGSKPMCLVGYRHAWHNVTDSFSSVRFFTRRGYGFIMHSGLTTWKKYESFFPMNHFALIDYQEPDGAVTILLINKKLLLQKVREQLTEFQRLYSKSIRPEDVLNQILNRDPIFFERFQANEIMKGILLGYGANNAKLFARKMQICNGLREVKHNGVVHTIQRKEISQHIVKPSVSFASLEDELRFLNEKTKLAGIPGSNFNFSPRVGFVADHQDPESQKLRRKYRQEKKQIPSIYARGDFLVTTLSKLVE